MNLALWKLSGPIVEGSGIRLFVRRIRAYRKALRLKEQLSRFQSSFTSPSLSAAMLARPEMLGALIWPYQCILWDARERLHRIERHYSVVDQLGYEFPITPAEMELANLNEIHEGLRIVVDQPKWFMREGELAYNLFIGEERVFTLAFSFSHWNQATVAVIGAVQGRAIENALELYRNLTKSCFGMRPRDFLIETFRIYCRILGLDLILAIDDKNRIHRSEYFAEKTGILADYDKIWAERGGYRCDVAFFRLDVRKDERDVQSIPAKKRSMYQRRREMLRKVEQFIASGQR